MLGRNLTTRLRPLWAMLHDCVQRVENLSRQGTVPCLWVGSPVSLRMSSVFKFPTALKRWVKLVLIVPETGLTDNPGASIESWGFAGRFPLNAQ